MAGVNKAIIVGNLGNDPEIRYSANGNAIASISVATSDRWKDKNTGEQQERTCLLYTSPSPRDATLSRMPSSA